MLNAHRFCQTLLLDCSGSFLLDYIVTCFVRLLCQTFVFGMYFKLGMLPPPSTVQGCCSSPAPPSRAQAAAP